MKDIMVLELNTYTYYDPTVSVTFYDKDYKSTFNGHRERYNDFYGDGEGHEYIIENRQDLIYALNKVAKCEEIDFPKCKIRDLIQLLKDTLLGDEFYDNIIKNIIWFQTFEKNVNVTRDESLDFYILENKNIAYWGKRNLDFQNLVLNYCIEKHIPFTKADFDISSVAVVAKQNTFSKLEKKRELADKKETLEELKKRMAVLIKEIAKLEEELKNESN